MQRGQGGPTRGSKVFFTNGSWPPAPKLANSATTRNISSNHLTLQKADAYSFSRKESSHWKRNNKKLTFWFQAATDMHQACSKKKQNHLQNKKLRRTQFCIQKTFSKPAPLKGPPYRAGPHMRSLISSDFPAPEMEPESAHVVSAVYVP